MKQRVYSNSTMRRGKRVTSVKLLQLDHPSSSGCADQSRSHPRVSQASHGRIVEWVSAGFCLIMFEWLFWLAIALNIYVIYIYTYNIHIYIYHRFGPAFVHPCSALLTDCAKQPSISPPQGRRKAVRLHTYDVWYYYDDLPIEWMVIPVTFFENFTVYIYIYTYTHTV